MGQNHTQDSISYRWDRRYEIEPGVWF